MSFSDKPRFHMGIKTRNENKGVDVPAPGTYNPDPSKIMKNLPSFSMKARLSSNLLNTSFAPGPGNYEVHLKNKRDAPKFGFGSSKRGGGEPKNISPGPGSYVLQSTVANVPSYSKGN